MQFHTGRRHTVAALLSAAGLVAGSGVAAAQFQPNALPGTDDSRVQITVGTDLATVTVDAADADATEVTGTFTNTSEATLACANPSGPGDAGTVTEADLVDRSLAYLESNTLPPAPPLPGLNTGSLDVMLGSGSLGSLGLGDPAAIELDGIQQAQEDERVAGHYGTAAVTTVESGATVDWSATLTVPSGDRTDFNAAALFTCQQEGQWYAFAGYEDGDDSDDSDGGDGGGSLSMGSLGS